MVCDLQIEGSTPLCGESFLPKRGPNGAALMLTNSMEDMRVSILSPVIGTVDRGSVLQDLLAREAELSVTPAMQG